MPSRSITLPSDHRYTELTPIYHRFSRIRNDSIPNAKTSRESKLNTKQQS